VDRSGSKVWPRQPDSLVTGLVGQVRKAEQLGARELPTRGCPAVANSLFTSSCWVLLRARHPDMPSGPPTNLWTFRTCEGGRGGGMSTTYMRECGGMVGEGDSRTV
jgi:hypothetical protein